MIPVRIGSTRLKQKNLTLLNGLPMMSYAIRSAIESGIFDRIVVNGDHPIFEQIARDEGVDYHQRPAELGSNHTSSDKVVFEFLSHCDTDILAWVNTTSPLQSGEDIRSAMQAMKGRHLDSLITTELRQVHARFDGHPLNYDSSKPFARTQDLLSIELFIYSLMAWRKASFMKTYRAQGSAMMCGRFGTHQVSREAGIIVKTESDFRLIAKLLDRQSEDRKLLKRYPVSEVAK
jgi:CMP-N-acetylneuraminic acid synthetase